LHSKSPAEAAAAFPKFPVKSIFPCGNFHFQKSRASRREESGCLEKSSANPACSQKQELSDAFWIEFAQCGKTRSNALACLRNKNRRRFVKINPLAAVTVIEQDALFCGRSINSPLKGRSVFQKNFCPDCS